MALFITGDTHGDYSWSKLNSKNFLEGTHLTRKDFVLIAGDFGGVWDNSKSDKYVQNWYNEKPWTTLFVDGNHENFDLLAQYPISEWNGGKVQFLTPNVIHLMRGQVFDIEGIKIFIMGGAQSHDKWHRREHESWWSQELPSNDEYEEAARNLEKVDGKVDIIVTHCGPDHIQDIVGRGWYEHDKLTNFLQITSEMVEYKYWFMGHYHQDRCINLKHYICYHDIYRVVKKDNAIEVIKRNN